VLERWPVLQHHQVTAHDVKRGRITRQALEAWAWSARERYLTQNHELHGLLGHGMHLDYEIGDVDDACLRIGAPSQVAVSAGVGAVDDDSFTLNTRVRAIDTKDEIAVTVPTTVRLVTDDGVVQPVTQEMRDAIAALERDAEHYN
jgi:acyl-CoA thioesterase FadM